MAQRERAEEDESRDDEEDPHADVEPLEVLAGERMRPELVGGACRVE